VGGGGGGGGVVRGGWGWGGVGGGWGVVGLRKLCFFNGDMELSARRGGEGAN